MWENLKLLQHISVGKKQECEEFENLAAANAKGKTNAMAKEAPVFTPLKHLIKVVSTDANTMPHTRAQNDVDQVFISCHVNGNHQMLVDVYLVRCMITVYDSHFSRAGWTKIKRQLTHMSFVIPELLKATRFQGS